MAATNQQHPSKKSIPTSSGDPPNQRFRSGDLLFLLQLARSSTRHPCKLVGHEQPTPTDSDAAGGSSRDLAQISTTVRNLYGSTTVRNLYGSTTVRNLYGSTTVRNLYGSTMYTVPSDPKQQPVAHNGAWPTRVERTMAASI
ncbi:hypothetical protein ACLOJK_029190 [Asimina triloba]